MSLISFRRGQGSIILRIKILDSSVATGAGKTGLAFNTAGLIISTIAENEAAATVYSTTGGTIETIAALGTFAAPTATKCRFKEVDAVNHKGVYEIQIANARFAVANAKSLLVSVSGAANAAETDAVVPLTDFDPYDAVRGAFTALPNAAAGANGGLPTVDAANGVKVSVGTAAGQVNVSAGKVPATIATGDMTDIPAVRAAKIDNADVATSTRMATFTLPANFADLSIVAGTGLVNISQTAADKVWGSATRSLTTFGTLVSDIWANATRSLTDKAGFALSAAGNLAIWDMATSLLTSVGSIGKLLVDNINATISSRLPTSSYTPPLDAAATRAALGLAANNLDTQLDALPTATENADALLGRNQKGGANGPAGQRVSDSLAGGFMFIDISAGVLTVKNGDGTTAYTRALTRAALDAIINAT